jgi:hypothetical protein
MKVAGEIMDRDRRLLRQLSEINQSDNHDGHGRDQCGPKATGNSKHCPRKEWKEAAT